MTRIYGCWICYNNIRTIRSSIESVYDYLDELVIVDGSFDGKTSDDGTWECVEEFKKHGKPIHHIKSKATTLFDKHNEHIAITGNNNPNIWTWQVDSDEIYMPEHANNIYELIVGDSFNGIGVKLLTISALDNERNGYMNADVYDQDTTQMRVYRMKDGLHFETRDGIFEHIVYSGGRPTQTPDNKIAYNNDKLVVYNYHCFDSYDKLVSRYTHYKCEDPHKMATDHMSTEGKICITNHPLKGCNNE